METSKYHTLLETPEWNENLIRLVYDRVFRTYFDRPGVALLSFAEPIESKKLRFLMWELKNRLSELHQQKTGKSLLYLSMGRFDSQNTTKFHLDGAPEEAFLMLGYEASKVISELAIADYSRAAHDWNISPQELLAQFNPMFADNEKNLAPYISKLSAFAPAKSHIVLLNNSSLPYSTEGENLLGVMHQATISPNPNEPRIINSTMISTASNSESEPMNAQQQRQFLEADELSGA